MVSRIVFTFNVYYPHDFEYVYFTISKIIDTISLRLYFISLSKVLPLSLKQKYYSRIHRKNIISKE